MLLLENLNKGAAEELSVLEETHLISVCKAAQSEPIQGFVNQCQDRKVNPKHCREAKID